LGRETVVITEPDEYLRNAQKTTGGKRKGIWLPEGGEKNHLPVRVTRGGPDPLASMKYRDLEAPSSLGTSGDTQQSLGGQGGEASARKKKDPKLLLTQGEMEDESGAQNRVSKENGQRGGVFKNRRENKFFGG